MCQEKPLLLTGYFSFFNLVFPMKKKEIAEHNDLVSAHYDMSATEQNIFCMVLRQIKQEDASNRVYKISVKDLEVATGKKLDYYNISLATKKLIARVCTIRRNNGNVLDVGMISDAEYVKGAGVVEIGLSPKIRPLLFDMKKHFTKYRFHMFMVLRSKYAKRLYKMLSQFKHTGIMRITVEELKSRLKLIDRNTNQEKYVEWSMFVQKVLEVSKRELLANTDIHFTYTARKTGKKYTDLEFHIQHVPHQLPLQFGEDRVIGSLYDRLTKEFRLSGWQANDIILNVPEEEIQKTLYDIKLKILDSSISNQGGFTAQTFENKYKLGFRKETIGN